MHVLISLPGMCFQVDSSCSMNPVLDGVHEEKTVGTGAGTVLRQL